MNTFYCQENKNSLEIASEFRLPRMLVLTGGDRL